MNLLRQMTALLWSGVGCVLIALGVIERATLARDAQLVSESIAAAYIPSLIVGAFLILAGCAIWGGSRKFRVAVVILCSILILYSIGLIFIGPEGSFVLTRVVPLLLATLSLWTAMNVRRWMSAP
jgi:hypothetical protein